MLAAVAVPPPGVPAALDVTSPTASQGPQTPSTAMIGSLQVRTQSLKACAEATLRIEHLTPVVL
jgi:hypothetical protein